MKNSIITFSTALIILVLAAFTFTYQHQTVETVKNKASQRPVSTDNIILKEANWASLVSYHQNVEALGNKVSSGFLYDIDSRFNATITKENLHMAVSAVEIVPKEANWWRYTIHSLEVTLLNDREETRTGDNAVLNKEQLQLLHTADYSQDLRLVASTKYEDLTYFITITPEREAEYISGKDALIAYLKNNSKDATANIKEENLRPGKIFFTVTAKGTIANVELISTSGYPAIDKTMVDLITNAPGKWVPAANAKGENVDQGLVFSFGITGC